MIMFIATIFIFICICAAAWPLPVGRYLAVIALVALIVFTVAPDRAEAAPPTLEQCSEAADLADGALKWRQAGITEEVAMGFLRQKKIYSGLPVWAIKQAFDAPADIAPWILKGSIFGECRKRTE